MEKLLLEIGAEEIPAGYIEPALKAMESMLLKKLDDARVAHGVSKVYGTPRRLAVEVADVAPKQRPMTTDVMGPPATVAFDSDGRPTMAAEKFAEKVKTAVDRLKVKQTPKGRYLYVKKTERGLATSTLLKEILPQVILATPFPKTMKWGDLHILFARPIHSILALLGSKIVSFSLENIKSGRYTRGHSFMQPAKLKIPTADAYVDMLRATQVLVDIAERKSAVEREINRAAIEAKGKILPDPELLDIVTNLVEFPAATVGQFDAEFLEVPDEILITAMREHQKYFAVIDSSDNLMPCFIAVNNTITRDMDLVARGHGRVIRARLADAQFFYRGDIQVPMADWVQKLQGVLFQAQLGTMHAKVTRVQALAAYLAAAALEQPEIRDAASQLKTHASRAALLSKADLVSQVVGEFPKLQGVMGRIYADVAGEAHEVASAVEEHYRPTYSGGALPETLTGAIVSIADKLDSICGCFSVGLAPTGTSDPYALRRQGIGLILTMNDKGLAFSLRDAISKSLSLYDTLDGSALSETTNDVYTFLQNRMIRLLADEGYAKDVIAAIASVSIDDVPDVWSRVRALENLKSEAEFQPLAAAFKRVVNIIRKADAAGAASVDPTLFEDRAETDLHAALENVGSRVGILLESGDYERALRDIASLKTHVDLFFEDVLVMADDQQVRRNRLALLGAIAGLFGRFADFSRITT